MSEYLTVHEIAASLGVTPATVQRWIRDGRLPAIKAGHSYRIAHSDFAVWRERAQQRPKALDVGVLNAALVGVMAFAGLRVSEVAGLELSHVDLGNRLIQVMFAKGGHPRMVGINARLKTLLAKYLKVRPAMGADQFFLSTRGRALNRQLIGRRIARVAKRSGLKVTPHGLRRTFATLNSNDGRSLNMLQLALGHRDISTTMEYVMTDNRQAAQQMQNW